MIIDSDIYTTHARSFGAGLAGVLSLQKAATAALPIHIGLRGTVILSPTDVAGPPHFL